MTERGKEKGRRARGKKCGTCKIAVRGEKVEAAQLEGECQLQTMLDCDSTQQL